MKRIGLFILLMLLVGTGISAATMRDYFKDAPDAFFPLLTHNSRLDMLDFWDSNMSAEVKNVYGQVSCMDTLTDNYIRIQMSVSSTWEMLLLDTPNDTLLCLVKTFRSPQAESTVQFYSLSSWKEEKRIEKWLTKPAPKDFVRFPKDMDKYKKQMLQSQMQQPYIVAKIDAKQKAILFSIKFVGGLLESPEDMNECVLPQVVRTWNGKQFR